MRIRIGGLRDRRRQRTIRLTERFQALPPRQRGVWMLAMLGNALLSTALDAVAGVALVRAGCRAWSQRRHGARAVLRASATPGLGWAVAAALAHQAVRVGVLRVIGHRRPSAHERP